jgi:hypothetical protein
MKGMDFGSAPAAADVEEADEQSSSSGSGGSDEESGSGESGDTEEEEEQDEEEVKEVPPPPARPAKAIVLPQANAPALGSSAVVKPNPVGTPAPISTDPNFTSGTVRLSARDQADIRRSFLQRQFGRHSSLLYPHFPFPPIHLPSQSSIPYVNGHSTSSRPFLPFPEHPPHRTQHSFHRSFNPVHIKISLLH